MIEDIIIAYNDSPNEESKHFLRLVLISLDKKL